MEGAVLYVALVKVFDVHHMKYLLTFTIVSYGQFILLLTYHQILNNVYYIPLVSKS